MFLKGKDLSFKYTSEKKILDGVSFTLQKNQTLSVVGASGCGKSTLLRIISSILPNSSDNRLDGLININGQTPNEYRKSGRLSFMFQESTLMPNLTVKENIAFPLKIINIKDDELVSNLLQIVGLNDYANYLPKQLSGGMKTRVALARSFVTAPELLLLDEPFSALDIAWKSKLYIELAKLLEHYHTTVVLVTHDVQEALLSSNNVIVLGKNGSIIHEEIIQSESSVMERIFDISNYINTLAYQEHFVFIQNCIMDDGIRGITGRNEVDKILNKTSAVAGHKNELWDSFRTDLKSIREFSNNPNVNLVLTTAFQKARSIDFKFGLVGDILNYVNLSESVKKEIFSFYFSNLEYLSTKSAKDFQISPEKIFDTLIKDKINGDRVRYPKEKLWIYLCDMYYSDETSRVVNYLEDVVRGDVEQLNYPFAKEVAKQIKVKIQNEKTSTVHIA